MPTPTFKATWRVGGWFLPPFELTHRLFRENGEPSEQGAEGMVEDSTPTSSQVP